MEIPILDHRDRAKPGPIRPWAATRLLVHDARLAALLAESLGRDGWEVAWTWDAEGSFGAWVRAPGASEAARGLGSSRLSAISDALVRALRASIPRPTDH